MGGVSCRPPQGEPLPGGRVLVAASGSGLGCEAAGLGEGAPGIVSLLCALCATSPRAAPCAVTPTSTGTPQDLGQGECPKVGSAEAMGLPGVSTPRFCPCLPEMPPGLLWAFLSLPRQAGPGSSNTPLRLGKQRLGAQLTAGYQRQNVTAPLSIRAELAGALHLPAGPKPRDP